MLALSGALTAPVRQPSAMDWERGIEDDILFPILQPISGAEGAGTRGP
jgi:hypothetical protein